MVTTKNDTTLTERRLEVRERLFRAAEGLFSELGFAGTSPADVAADARIARTTFYEYFTDMEDLLAGLVEARLPAVAERLLGGLPAEAGPRELLGELAVRMVEFAATDHVLGLELHQGLPVLSAATQQRVRTAHRGLSTEFRRIYTAGVETGEFRAMPPELAAAFLNDLVLAAAKVLMRVDEPKAHLREVADELVAFLLHGLDPV
jgi:AcrR family transcriptional regulator